ncbi:DUF4426 domain-containing protein [Marinimicrobium agarilyticum]|uniref:DUF4426 domain-containing protein n=1 Tax=Marinimicrobium agarilyticum TaxID=306546 RepID=UPI0003F5F74B|nr:DUF4426 domain-containing protein [Marinimicrobium agarilyticum]
MMSNTRSFWISLLLTFFLASPALAQSGSERFGDYQVYYSVFNSTFVPADIAAIHGLVRGEDRALINISVTSAEGGLGQKAEVNGTATNLMQQAQPLDFQEINEGGTYYYIAPMRHTEEEVYNFRVNVKPEGAERAFELTFSQKMYTEPSH